MARRAQGGRTLAGGTRQQAEATSTLIDGIERVDLRVTDVDKAVAFYRDLVGLEVVESDRERAKLRGPHSPVLLTLDSAGVQLPAKPDSTGLFHTAFRYAERRTLGLALSRLVDRGIEVGAGDHGVSEALYVDDPDGNGVELYWDRPRDVWPSPRSGQRVGMYTAPVDLRALLDEGRQAEPSGEAPVIGHVHIQVRDVSETMRFYVDVLGFDLMATMGSSAAFLSSHGYHHHIGANAWNSRGASPAPLNHAGLERIVFQAASPAEIQRARGRLEADGVEHATQDGGLVVRDPNGIELWFR